MSTPPGPRPSALPAGGARLVGGVGPGPWTDAGHPGSLGPIVETRQPAVPQHAPVPGTLRLRGAREHTLRDVDLDLPHGEWVAVTGVSGSGKSSLVFDVLVREGQRRFLGSLSPKARQLYGKLGRAALDELSGLPAPLAVGQHTAAESERSTVGTITGALDLLRLLFARQAVDPGGVALTRSHFSFNRPQGACPTCQGLGLTDRVDPELLVADPSRTLRGGALRPTLKNGYTVYSQVTVEVMETICAAHGFDMDTPWRALSDAQREVILYGTKALKVPFGKHGLESRLRWEGITARPREEGYYRGLVPVIEETLARDRNPNILRFVRSEACPACGGTRLDRPGREARLGERTLPALAALPVADLPAALDDLPASPVLDALRPSLDARLARMARLDLAHLALDRTAPTLSGGEAQRLRLAAQLVAGLSRQLVALDEPTLGLHPQGQAGLAAVLDELRDLGNTLLVVEHDPDMVRHADRLVRLGPGAGSQGGRLLASAPLEPAPAQAPGPLAGPTRRAGPPRTPDGWLTLTGATLHGLREADLRVGRGTLHVVLGPSGAGKTSLVFGTLLPALTGEAGGPFASLEGVPDGPVSALDARPLGRTPRSTPATWTGLFDRVRKRFAALPESRERGLKAGHFSYNGKQGRCPACQGLGWQRVGLHLLEDLELACPDCAGGRYGPDVLDVRLDGRTIAEVLALTVDQALEVFADDPDLAGTLEALASLGLGYLQLGQPSGSLSRGEGQRVKLATLLAAPRGRPGVVLLDEPDRGLHPEDVERLLAALGRLADAGHTVLAISHHRQLWAAADGLTELRDGAARPLEAPDLTPRTATRGARPPAPAADAIRLRGARQHNLQGLDIDLPHGALTVVAGVSGSGKSSLVFHTLAAEAWHRTAEGLPFAVRRHVRRLPRPDLDEASGLGPTLALQPGAARAGSRSTVATQSELGPWLRLLWSRAGALDGRPCELSAAHFSRDRAEGACLACEGGGTRWRCDPDRLVTDPERPLGDGALAGTRVGAYLGEPDGQFLATLAAVLDEPAVLERPWRELPEAVRRVALEGAGERRVAVTWSYRRGRRTGEHHFEGTWDGLLVLAEQEAARRARSKAAAAWRAPLVEAPCPACDGAGLGPEPARVTVGGLTLPEALALPAAALGPALAEALPRSLRPELAPALLPEIDQRLEDLLALGLGHLSLDRPSATLSDGELQRLRLAGLLRSGLSGLTLALDEPASGLHPRDVQRLVERLRRLVAEGHTVVAVSHRPELMRAADQLVELGPGSGPDGGRLLAQGPPAQVLAGDGPTARALAAGAARSRRPAPTADGPRLTLGGAHAHNLADLDLDLPLSGFVCVTGVSGAGKSSLVFDVLEASARAGAPVGCRALTGPPVGDDPWPLARFAEVVSARRPGQQRSVLAALGLMPALQGLYHGCAAGTGLPRAAFSFLSPAGRCGTCQGSGRETVALDFMADLALPCPDCAGRRYRDEVLAVHWEGLDVATFLERPAAELGPRLPRGRLADACGALVDLGLGALSLGRAPAELSAGERQRVALAASLTGRAAPCLHLLDEPARGLHEADIGRLVEVLERLTARGDLVLAAEHRESLVAAADEVLELGPEGGPGGGRLVAHGRRGPERDPRTKGPSGRI